MTTWHHEQKREKMKIRGRGGDREITDTEVSLAAYIIRNENAPEFDSEIRPDIL